MRMRQTPVLEPPTRPVHSRRPDRIRGARTAFRTGEGRLVRVATAAAQIEENNQDSDWWVWTAEPPEGSQKPIRR